MNRSSTAISLTEKPAKETVLKILITLSLAHLLNDTIQSLIPAVYPLLKVSFHLSFTQIGMITFVFQLTASILQPLVGSYTDRRPQSHSLVFGMSLTLCGLVLLALAWNFTMLLCAAALVGTGSSVFHPEASRLARLASGGKHGFAQSLFQVGGNLGSSFGPLLAAAIVVPFGQKNILWFSLAVITGIFVMNRVGNWYRKSHLQVSLQTSSLPLKQRHHFSSRKIGLALSILIILIFSKYFYLASLTNYYTFFLIHKFQLSIPQSQIYLFLFLFAVAAGTIIGGPVGDRFGRKYVIWFSILGAAPFALAMPYANLFWTVVLSVIIGLILASAFSAILVYALELMPGKVGLIAGLFFGFAFGIAGIASALLGKLADHTNIEYVFYLCSFLPLLGLFTAFLPNLENDKFKNSFP